MFQVLFLVHFRLLVPSFSSCTYNESVVYSPVVVSQKSLSRDRWGVSHLAPRPSGRWSLPLAYKPWLEGKVGETYQGEWKKEEGALLSVQVRSSFCPTATVTPTNPEHKRIRRQQMKMWVKMCRNIFRHRRTILGSPKNLSVNSYKKNVLLNMKKL